METESINENVGITPITSSGVSKRKGKTKKSDVWNHFSVKQKTLSFQSMNNRGQQPSCFSVDTCRKLLAKMIITDELSLKFVEGEGFRAFSQYLQPRFSIPSRVTVARDIFNLYETEKMKLKEYFRRTSQRVCLTTDIWTSIHNLNYMALTAHYIDSDWTMRERILNFCLISNHKGDTIGKEVERCLLEWGIENVLTVTVDDASSNDIAISYLIKSVRNWNGLILNGEYMHVRCVAHILNLIVSDGLKDHQEVISKVRRAVKYVRFSPARLQIFKNCIDNVKIACKSSISLDVSTRWNSTYLMLSSAEKFEKAFAKLLEIDSNYVGDLSGESPLTTTDWENIRELLKFLKIFYDTTVIVSASSRVTSNIYFGELCNLKMVIMEYAQSDNPSLRNMAIGMEEKFDKYWGSCEEINFFLYVAVVLDPRCKIQFLQYCLTLLVENNRVTDLVNRVRSMINRLYGQYNLDLGLNISQDTCVTSSSTTRQITSFAHNKVYEIFYSRRSERNASSNRTEVDIYLSEELEKFSDNQDILIWWKVNSLKYPILSKIAKDILSIPISTVPWESAFSCEGRVLDSFRSSLSPNTVEALICTQSWIRETNHNVTNFNDIADEFDEDFMLSDEDSEPMNIGE